jgi:hypothetical protein
MDLPDRKDLPDYYKIITRPISLREIEVCHHLQREARRLTTRIV